MSSVVWQQPVEEVGDVVKRSEEIDKLALFFVGNIVVNTALWTLFLEGDLLGMINPPFSPIKALLDGFLAGGLMIVSIDDLFDEVEKRLVVSENPSRASRVRLVLEKVAFLIGSFLFI